MTCSTCTATLLSHSKAAECACLPCSLQEVLTDCGRPSCLTHPCYWMYPTQNPDHPGACPCIPEGIPVTLHLTVPLQATALQQDVLAGLPLQPA